MDYERQKRVLHRKISIGYLPYFRGVERGGERTVKKILHHTLIETLIEDLQKN